MNRYDRPKRVTPLRNTRKSSWWMWIFIYPNFFFWKISIDIKKFPKKKRCRKWSCTHPRWQKSCGTPGNGSHPLELTRKSSFLMPKYYFKFSISSNIWSHWEVSSLIWVMYTYDRSKRVPPLRKKRHFGSAFCFAHYIVNNDTWCTPLWNHIQCIYSQVWLNLQTPVSARSKEKGHWKWPKIKRTWRKGILMSSLHRG